MNGDRLDGVARMLAGAPSRRGLLKSIAQAAIGSVLAAWPRRGSPGQPERRGDVLGGPVVGPGLRDNSATIEMLAFKGTHNSWNCAKPHPVEEQIDRFGVWAVEIDFGLVREGDELRAVVGHDGPDEAACWAPGAYYLADFVARIRATRALRYHHRPVFLYLDPKTWGERVVLGVSLVEASALPILGPTVDPAVAFATALAEIRRVVPAADVVVLDDYLAASGGRFPTVAELAGKIVLPPIGDRPAGETLAEGWETGCTDAGTVERAIRTGRGIRGTCNRCLGEATGCVPGCHVLRLEDYAAAWTFEYGVPPNPLVVDAAASPPGDGADLDGCASDAIGPGEQGTWHYPFRRLGAAVTRARGETSDPAAEPERIRQRAGIGWTILLRPGVYPEALTIASPLTLRRDPETPGLVVIGRR